jgi:acid phosphatase class B
MKKQPYTPYVKVRAYQNYKGHDYLKIQCAMEWFPKPVNGWGIPKEYAKVLIKELQKHI